ncbi:hypothetical protein P4U43_08745 [Arthrobacter sp. EH-1B-1]|uniref:Uncharacterized protein n=1 Tax=Arthrobacter vasquezii TaxID=2977629 RepID=A0ABT6CXT9_9MICC|nr:hypothetical protein [Arthrobacter vasquezii]MDF9277874.1 hypothetical protein [Arthrobacter vasquezii]
MIDSSVIFRPTFRGQVIDDRNALAVLSGGRDRPTTMTTRQQETNLP